MRIDRGANKGMPGEVSTQGKETTIQKKGAKITLDAGTQDTIHISQNQNRLRIQINDGKAHSLTPEESRNLEITGHSEKVFIDRGVTLPILGMSVHPKETKEGVLSKTDGPVAAGRKEETAFTAGVTRKFLASELETFQIENPESGSPQKAPDTSRVSEDLAPNRSAFQAPGFASLPNATPLKTKENTSTKTETSGTGAALKEEASFRGTIKMNALSSELKNIEPSAALPGPGESPKADGAHAATGPRMPSVLPQQDLQATGENKMEAAEAPNTSEFLQPKEQLIQLMENPRALASVLPEMKGNLIEKLSNENRFSVFEERAVHSLLLGAASSGEFQTILPDLAGLKLAQTFKSPEMRTSWDRLVSAFDRPELGLNPAEVKKTQGLFLQNSEKLQQLTPGCAPEVPQELSLPESMEERLPLLDRSAFACLVLENKVREIEGRPLIHAADLRKEIFEILMNPSLPLEERLPQMESARIDSGLSQFQMREIVSRPLANLFEAALSGLNGERDSVIQSLDARLRDAVASFGPESVAVEIVKAEHLETLSNMEPQIERLMELKTSTNEMFSGPADPLVKMDRVFENLLNTVFPMTQQAFPEVNRMLQGADIFRTGKLETSLGNLIRADIPEIKGFAESAASFVASVNNGTYPALLMQIVSQPIIAKDSEISPELRDAAHFFGQLADGAFSHRIQSCMDAMVERSSIPPEFRELLSRVPEWRLDAANSPDIGVKDSLLSEGKRLAHELVNTIQGSIPALSRGATELVADPRFKDAMETLKTSREVMIAFRNDKFVQLLTTLNNRMAGSPAVLQIIQQALHITNSGTPFFRGLLNREWERPIFSALKKSTGGKELQEVAGILTDTLNLFLPLTSVEDSSPFLQYSKQLGYLKDEEMMSDWIQHYESMIK